MVRKQEKDGELIRFPEDWSAIAVISEIRAGIKKFISVQRHSLAVLLLVWAVLVLMGVSSAVLI